MPIAEIIKLVFGVATTILEILRLIKKTPVEQRRQVVQEWKEAAVEERRSLTSMPGPTDLK